MRFFLTHFVVTLSTYGLTSFLYPSEEFVIPSKYVMWAAPILGTLAALIVTRVSSLVHALGAQALAL
jgi:hypothetical protein